MRRRDFIIVLGGAAAAWPLGVAAQPAKPVVGVLAIGTALSYDLTEFRRGLKDAGYVEGQNLAIEYRWADENPDRLHELASDLVRAHVRVIAAIASGLAARAAKDATSEIPIVFGYGADPVKQGLVASLNRPGGNATGVISLASELIGKQLGIMHELLRQASSIGLLVYGHSAIRDSLIDDARRAAAVSGQTIDVLVAASSEDIDAAFADIANRKSVQALLVTNDPFFLARCDRLADLAARNSLPAIYPFREHVEAGGLISYGPNLRDRDREVGRYVGRILRGENVTELPVEQMNKFELIINMKAAKGLGLTIPNSMQLLADEIVE